MFYFLVIQLRFCNTYRPCIEKFERSGVVNEIEEKLEGIRGC